MLVVAEMWMLEEEELSITLEELIIRFSWLNAFIEYTNLLKYFNGTRRYSLRVLVWHFEIDND